MLLCVVVLQFFFRTTTSLGKIRQEHVPRSLDPGNASINHAPNQREPQDNNPQGNTVRSSSRHQIVARVEQCDGSNDGTNNHVEGGKDQGIDGIQTAYPGNVATAFQTERILQNVVSIVKGVGEFAQEHANHG